MTCIHCGKMMTYYPAPAWTSLLVCDFCDTRVEVHHSDLMSGALIANRYYWTDGSNNELVKYDETRDKERINVVWHQ